MDVENNHLVTEQFLELMTKDERENYIHIPAELNRAARRALGKKQERKISFISNGKLSKWARKIRKEATCNE